MPRRPNPRRTPSSSPEPAATSTAADTINPSRPLSNVDDHSDPNASAPSPPSAVHPAEPEAKPLSNPESSGSEDDMELLNRVSDSGSRAPSQDHPAQEPGASENEAEMNALGRTQPFQNSEREGGFTAGSPNLVTREERREANSQDAADYAEEEIRRLDAQLDAARLRFANLKQNLAVKTQEESKKFPPEISTEAPASAGALSDGTEAPKTPVSSNRDRAQNKDTTEVFILDEEAEEAAKQQQANAEQELSRANNKRGATAQATLTPQTPTEEAAGAKPKRTAKPTLATKKAVERAKLPLWTSQRSEPLVAKSHLAPPHLTMVRPPSTRKGRRFSTLTKT